MITENPNTLTNPNLPMSFESVPVVTPPDQAMQVRKRNGQFEPVDLNKIVRAVLRSCAGLSNVDSMKVATKTIGGIYDGATTKELDSLSIQTAAHLISEEPEYSKLAARFLCHHDQKGSGESGHQSFSQSIAMGYEENLISEVTYAFVKANARKLNDGVVDQNTELFEYFGLRTIYDRYLLKHPISRNVIETPQYFFYMRVAWSGSAKPFKKREELYNLISSFEYMPSTPTLFNSATHKPFATVIVLFARLAPKTTCIRFMTIGSYLSVAHCFPNIRRRNRHRVPSRSFARIADPRHQRVLEWSRVRG